MLWLHVQYFMTVCNVSQVELEMAINTLSPNYCRSKGEQIALNVDGTTYEETNTYSTYVLPSCHSS